MHRLASTLPHFNPTKTMSQHTLIAVLLIFCTKELHGQLRDQFNSALLNDLDSECLNKKGIDFDATIKKTRDCVVGPFEKVLAERLAFPKVQEAVGILVCKDKVVQKCCKEMRDAVNPCLVKEDQEILLQIHKVVQTFLESLCAYDVIHFKDTNCTEVYRFGENDPNCKLNFKDDKRLHLKDFFTPDSCQKYKKLIECRISTLVDCPNVKQLYSNLFNNMYKASPCST